MTAKVRDMMEPSLISIVQVYANHPILKAKEYLGPSPHDFIMSELLQPYTQSSLSDVKTSGLVFNE